MDYIVLRIQVRQMAFAAVAGAGWLSYTTGIFTNNALLFLIGLACMVAGTIGAVANR